MGAWLSTNFWWLLPVALLPIAAFASVHGHKRILRTMPEGQRSHFDAIAKQVLGVLALLLTCAAFRSRYFLGLVPPLFMFASLQVPFSKAVTLPNWVRYAAYFSLFFVYLIFFPATSDG